MSATNRRHLTSLSFAVFLAATLVGIALGSVWNYSTAFLFVWQVRRRRTERLDRAYAESPLVLVRAGSVSR